MLARSYLYVPGDRRDRLARAAARGADALVLDLEDAVAQPSKDEARAATAEFLATAPVGPQVWVRVNADRLADDLAAVAVPRCAGVLLPKAEPALLAAADAALGAAERAQALPAGTFRVVPVIETARGLLAAAEIAAAPRVLRMGIGEADLAAELGVQPGPERAELASHRAALVVASVAAGVAAPIAPVETDLTLPDETFAVRTRALLREGFRARTTIHPRQVPIVNAVFTPSPTELAAARDVLERLVVAEGERSGVAVDAAGRLIDEAVARSAREVVGRAAAPAPRG